MLVEILTGVTSAFVQVLTAEFLTKRRSGVNVTDLREEVVRLAQEQGRLANEAATARRAVLMLTRLLTSGRVFEIRDDELLIARDWPELDPGEVEEHLRRFELHIQNAAQRRAGRASSMEPRISQPGQATTTRTPRPRNSLPASQDPATDDALNRFFDGYDDALRAERQGLGRREGE